MFCCFFTFSTFVCVFFLWEAPIISDQLLSTFFFLLLFLFLFSVLDSWFSEYTGNYIYFIIGNINLPYFSFCLFVIHPNLFYQIAPNSFYQIAFFLCDFVAVLSILLSILPASLSASLWLLVTSFAICYCLFFSSSIFCTGVTFTKFCV